MDLAGTQGAYRIWDSLSLLQVLENTLNREYDHTQLPEDDPPLVDKIHTQNLALPWVCWGKKLGILASPDC